nr:protein FAM133A-like [Aegilops tauschii subsp. strangulata]
MSQTAPISAITDGDGSMAKAIATVWTGTDHRLCTWHIEENMVIHLCKKKLEEFREFIYRHWDVDEFEKRWEAYKVRFKIKPAGKRSSWVNRMDARELQGKDGNDSDAKVPTDLEGKDAEDLHAKNLDAEDPNDLEGKDGVDLHAKNLDAKEPNDLEGAKLDAAACKCKKKKSGKSKVTRRKKRKEKDSETEEDTESDTEEEEASKKQRRKKRGNQRSQGGRSKKKRQSQIHKKRQRQIQKKRQTQIQKKRKIQMQKKREIQLQKKRKIQLKRKGAPNVKAGRKKNNDDKGARGKPVKKDSRKGGKEQAKWVMKTKRPARNVPKAQKAKVKSRQDV